MPREKEEKRGNMRKNKSIDVKALTRKVFEVMPSNCESRACKHSLHSVHSTYTHKKNDEQASIHIKLLL